jgi:hypothetical protein
MDYRVSVSNELFYIFGIAGASAVILGFFLFIITGIRVREIVGPGISVLNLAGLGYGYTCLVLTCGWMIPPLIPMIMAGGVIMCLMWGFAAFRTRDPYMRAFVLGVGMLGIYIILMQQFTVNCSATLP